ncbi:MAG: hydrolase [Candidatus Methanoperedens nitroreducens]|uniref:Hydrolase n=1 Tax=Candidatus Methanoperedens nitratireducens TaxID=1392998 RepID=A0A0P7ZJI7_9EURY|nr:MBL fold metallo-hydrolase [Candidatus Methanoperedens sp. BLZ2]KAB2946303.1 MAG: MBL fold metallo-hydrolase [Candidatus Methanoperedens sp.]KPQ45278.1 MAG: hydrolase [Candidatus Methanoperedens sp. BLZ1]MBZ0176057.1 MBL fold metallo-hydrolase [Candidatus Methanoperedens nitroreducens]MCX9076787.1 rhodanese-like domain-containing protein [Candidatus Methanoperedens sp.]
MFIERLVSKGLSHFSYIAGNDNNAFVVDPKRDVDSYIKIAKSNCCRIRYVFETHCNEDYLIGSLELEKRTGCRIIHSYRLNFGYGEPATETDTFDIGGIRIRVIETPGHSRESLSFVLYAPSGEIPLAVFTGDALFYGNVGRTDLSGREKIAEYASILYDSVHGKLLSLGDGTIVYPAHGAGSACGGTMSDIAISTIGYERAANPMLGLTREEFIERKKKENIPLPPYFARMANHNLNGPRLLEPGQVEPMDAPAFAGVMGMDNSIIVDTRSPFSFAGGHIKGSYNIWLGGLPQFAGWIIGYERDVLLVTERQGDVEAAQRYLSRVGLDKVKGYLCEGIGDWMNHGMPLEQSGLYTVEGLNEKLKEEDLFVVDVRDKEEYAQGHIPGAVNIYVGELEKRLSELPSDRPVVSVCSTGNRSGLGASILARGGLKKVHNLMGGMTAWKEKGYSTRS